MVLLFSPVSQRRVWEYFKPTADFCLWHDSLVFPFSTLSAHTWEKFAGGNWDMRKWLSIASSHKTVMEWRTDTDGVCSSIWTDGASWRSCQVFFWESGYFESADQCWRKLRLGLVGFSGVGSKQVGVHLQSMWLLQYIVHPRSASSVGVNVMFSFWGYPSLFLLH